MTMDLKDFYLMSSLEEPQYMRIKTSQMSEEIRKRYQLDELARNGSVLFKVTRGLYGLPEAGRLAQKQLREHLAKFGYEAPDSSPCLFSNKDKTLTFSLVVDDFGIKYKRKADVLALQDALTKGGYKFSQDWSGSKYLGFKIDWDYEKDYVDLSLPGHIKDLAVKLDLMASQRRDAPGAYAPPSFGSKVQWNSVDESRQLDASELLLVQRIVGSLLYYARAVDPTMLTAINKISTMAPTESALKAAHHLFDYAQSWNAATLRYHASDMRLVVYSDASYLGESKSRSRQGGIHFMGYNDDPKTMNGAVECISSLIRVIVASAAEAEYGALYENGVTAEGLRTTLEDLGYPQGPTQIFTDNTCAQALANNECKEKRTKAIDKDFHWIRCRVKQGHFTVHYVGGKENPADIFTKLLPVASHQEWANKLVHYSDKPKSPRAASRAHLQAKAARWQRARN
jgi:hypothetical protein